MAGSVVLCEHQLADPWPLTNLPADGDPANDPDISALPPKSSPPVTVPAGAAPDGPLRKQEFGLHG